MNTRTNPTVTSAADRELVEGLNAVAEFLADIRHAKGAPRIDVGIEVTKEGAYFVASIWTSPLVRPTRVECPTAEMLVDSLCEIVEAFHA
jgi:hypothetical protein